MCVGVVYVCLNVYVESSLTHIQAYDTCVCGYVCLNVYVEFSLTHTQAYDTCVCGYVCLNVYVEFSLTHVHAYDSGDMIGLLKLDTTISMCM